MNRLLLLLGVIALSFGPHCTVLAETDPGPADVPRERIDAKSQRAHQDLLRKTRQGVIDAYFIGDSITRRWGALDYPLLLNHWNHSFHGWNAANFAWGGDRTQDMLWRLENGELEGLSPGIIAIQAGTNNLGDITEPQAQAAAIVTGISAIVDASRRRVPGAVIVLTAVFPRRDHPEYNPVIDDINGRLRRLADEKGLRFIDINGQLRDDEGLLTTTMSEDGLHLSLAAYDIWAQALKPVFSEVLGPASDTDCAPPPTGDPGVLDPTLAQ